LLRRTDEMRAHARAVVESLIGSLGSAVMKPHVAELMEDYQILGIRDATVRMKTLEWVVIILFTVEIVLGVVRE